MNEDLNHELALIHSQIISLANAVLNSFEGSIDRVGLQKVVECSAEVWQRLEPDEWIEEE